VHDAVLRLVSQQLVSQALEAVVIEGVDGRVEGVDAVLVSLLDGLGGVLEGVKDLLLGLDSSLESSLGFSLLVSFIKTLFFFIIETPGN